MGGSSSLSPGRRNNAATLTPPCGASSSSWPCSSCSPPASSPRSSSTACDRRRTSAAPRRRSYAHDDAAEAATRRGEVPWPMFGLDATRTRSVDARGASRRSGRSGVRRGSLVEFPPSIGYGRLYFSTNSGRFAAISTEDRQARVEGRRCTAASRHRRRSGRTHTAPSTPCSSTGRRATPDRRPRNDGLVVAFSAGSGRSTGSGHRPVGELAAAHRRPPLRRRLERRRVGDRRRQRKTIWRRHIGGAVKGAVASAGGKSVRRLVRRAPVLPVARRARSLEVQPGQAAALRARAVLLDAGGRVRPRLHRLDRREGLLVRRHERKAALVALDRRLRVRSPAVCERHGVRRLVQQALLRLRRGDRRREVELRRERPDLRLGDGRRRHRLLRDARSHAHEGGRTR